jgi:hypothetical protein
MGELIHVVIIHVILIPLYDFYMALVHGEIWPWLIVIAFIGFSYICRLSENSKHDNTERVIELHRNGCPTCRRRHESGLG